MKDNNKEGIEWQSNSPGNDGDVESHMVGRRGVAALGVNRTTKAKGVGQLMHCTSASWRVMLDL